MSSTTTTWLTRRGVLVAAVAATAAGCGADRSTRTPPSGARVVDPTGGRLVEIHVDGESFRPVVELVTEEDSTSTSQVDVTWVDLDSGATLGTGSTPTLSIDGVSRVGLQVTSGEAPAYDQVLTLNLGFRRDDDYGRLSLPTTYEHEPQPVTGVAGLFLLTGLVRFCAARTPLSGLLDLGGLSRLEHVECYGSEVDAIDLTGCSSLVRLVVEDCRLDDLDLQPVRRTLQDLRAAVMRSDSLTLQPLDGPMESLYHYCVREQLVHGSIPHSQLPAVEEYWVWATGQATCDAPTSPRLGSLLARDNPYDQSSVDAVLLALQALTTEEGRVDLSGEAPGGRPAAEPSPEGSAAAAALLEAGWRVSTN